MFDERYDIVVFGATGFTGQLALEYLAQREHKQSIAIAGRDHAKLTSIAQRFPSVSFGVIVADVSDEKSIDEMVSRTRVLINFTGPYDKYGSVVVKACVKHGVQYCDITGEAFWNKKMIEQFHAQAQQSQALIVSFCGFDSIPFDLPVLKIVQYIRDKHKCGTGKVQTVVDLNGGGFSGGTFQSFLNAFENNYATSPKYSHPYALNPQDDPEYPPNSKVVRKEDKDYYLPWYDSKKAEWRNFWVMTSTNSKVVRRSQRLFKQIGFDYGKNFAYLTEAQRAKSLFRAILFTLLLVVFVVLALIPFTRRLLQKYGPQPGSGPSQESRDTAKTTITITAKVDDSSRKEVIAVLTGRDLGYTDTAKMIVESALLLASKKNELKVKGGVVTPAFAFGSELLDILNEQKVLNFQILE
jgi:short subunit dehydrogenase-like uncharacterized protein